MTSTDRLRAIAGAWDEWGLGGTLAEIADEIERERAEDCYRMGLDCGTVWRVMLDMERHCLGHEGMEDSPVARWARELRGALKSDASDGSDRQKPSCADPDGAADVTSEAQKVTRDHAEDVSMSAYDLLPEDEREAISWVREHGGLDHVKAEWSSRVPHDLYERRRQHLLDHIAECETALGRRNERIEELGHRVSDLTRENAELRRRAMPEGCRWPRYEDGELVNLGDRYECWCGETHAVCSVTIREGRSAINESHPHTFVVSDGPFTAHGKRVKRPAVPASDGKPLEVGQTVWDENGDELVIGAIEDGGHTVTCRYADVGDGIPVHGMWSPSDLTHQRPVLDAGGAPIKVGEHVWDDHGEELVVLGLSGGLVRCRFNGEACIDSVDDDRWEPSQLTHEPPDSWERIEEDAGCTATKYNERRGTIFTTKQQVARDLVRRCRALAERERGE